MNQTCDPLDPQSVASPNDRCSLQNGFLTKSSLLVFSKALVDLFPVSCGEVQNYTSHVEQLKNWTGTIKRNITFQESFQSALRDIVNNNYTGPNDTVYLSSFDTDLAAISNWTRTPFYSTSMIAISAYAPPVRNSQLIRFLQNIDSTMAEITSSLLQQRQAEITFIYDDHNKLIFLIRIVKNVYFRTIFLSQNWTTDRTVQDVLVPHFKKASNLHTYILLFQNSTRKLYSEKFLELAMMNKQLREGIQIISYSVSDSCSIYNNYLGTGASLVTFGLSTTYAPETPSPFYDPTWRAAATYLDGLTYITENGTQVPSSYILSRINFSLSGPTASPVEAVAILDCSKDTNKGLGSWLLNRAPKLKLDSINSTLIGRTIKVGIIKYPPFFENDTGFSVPVMSTLAMVAKVNYEISFFTPNPSEPYYAAMKRALENQEIDASFALVPLSMANTEKVAGSVATLTISFNLLRQRPSRPADALLLLRPLSMPVWLAAVVLAFIFTGLLMVFGHLRPVIMHNLAEGELTSKRDLFEVSALGVASIFSLTKLQIIPTTLSSRIFALTMWMFSYLLLVLYASAMMTILLRIRAPDAVITADEVLAATHESTLFILKNGIAYDSIVTSLRNISKPFSTVDSIIAAYDVIMKNEGAVLLASSIEASYISVMSCEIEMIPYTAMYEMIMTFPYNKLWKYGTQFNFYLSLISQAGVLLNAASVYFETGRCYQPKYSVPHPVVLEVRDVASIFIFLFVGIAVAFIIMGLEVLIKRLVDKNNAKNFTLLIPGRHYTAKIISVKRNGINVNVENRPESIFIPNSQLHADPLKVYNALDMGLSEGDSIEVTYFGKASDGTTELFCRYLPEE